MPTTASPTLMPGAEPFFLPRGRTGCLLIHGFTASPQEMRRLGEYLAGRGYTALGVRLAGHGTRVQDLARSRWLDWLASAQDGYRLLRGACDQVIVMGLSLGGVLTLLLAASHPVDGLVAMSTPILPYRHLLRSWLRPASALVPFIRKGPPDWRDPQAGRERVAYAAYPTRALIEVQAAMAAAREALGRVNAPALLIHSSEDRFVVPANSQAIFDRLGSADKHLLLVSDSNHVITCDRAREQVFAAAADFARRAAGEHA